MKQLKKLFLFWASCLSLSGYANAQSPAPIPDNLPQVFSPNAAELGKYGKIPVNYFNGLPNISVPLTELKAKGYTLPIYLSYHASGNKPDQHPGWVGLGWSLHAGGCINRVVNGMKDEMNLYEYRLTHKSSPTQNPGYYHYRDYVQKKKDWMTNIPLNDLHAYDYNPDEFQVCIDDIQASFYLTEDGGIKIVSKSAADFKVDIHMTDGERNPILIYPGPQAGVGIGVAFRGDYFDRITITNSDGTVYVFGGSDDAIEYSMPLIPQFGEYGEMTNLWLCIANANSWLLTRIERPDGEVITFTYTKDGTPIVRQDVHHSEFGYLDNNLLTPYSFNTKDRPLDKHNISFTLIQPSYLENIHCSISTDNLVFSRETTTELGYYATLKDFENEFEKRAGNYTFTSILGTFYSYDQIKAQDYYMQLSRIFGPNRDIRLSYSSDSLRRLTLQQVSFCMGDNASDHQYSFDYDPERLPSYHARQSDLWGFYNGIDYSSTHYKALERVRKQVNPAKAKAEILTAIHYPTGGWTEFEYEGHDYSKEVTQVNISLADLNNTVAAGGLRIKEIRDYSVAGKPEIRTFSYRSSSGLSSGILAGSPALYDAGSMSVTRILAGIRTVKMNGIWFLIAPLASGIYSLLNGEYNAELEEDGFYEIFSENPIRPLSTTDGNHVTYSQVKETQPDGSYSVYQYTNHDYPFCCDTEPTWRISYSQSHLFFNTFNSRELFRGLLLHKEDYSANDKLVRDEKNEYSIDTTQFIKAINAEKECNGYIRRDSYQKVFSAFPYMKRKTVSLYPDDGGTPSVDTTDFEYNSHRQLIKTIRSNSSNREETRMSYSGDMPGSNALFGEMQSSWILDRPVEQTVLRDGEIVSSSLITYRKSGTQFVPDKYYESRLNAPVSPSSWTPYNGTQIQIANYGAPKLSFDSYDTLGNLLYATDEGGQVSRYYWDSVGLHPEASFTGMSMSSTGFYSFEKDGNCADGFKGFNSSNAWRGSKSFYLSIPSGVPYTIDWMEKGSNGKWEYHSEPFTGSKSLGGSSKTIDNVRIYPSAATATCWTWTPTGELSSVTDVSGITNSYEYDGMGRLVTVLDTDGKKIATYDYHYHYAIPSASIPDSYVKTSQYSDESGASAYEMIQYYDGLGRPWQSLHLNAGRDDAGTHMMHLCERTDYDNAGRPYKKWLPFRTANVLPQTAANPSESIYSDSEPFSIVEYDSSPLSRTRAEYGPGAKWHASRKAVNYGYYTNSSNPLLNCRNYSVSWTNDTTVIVSCGEMIKNQTLAVNIMRDENGLSLMKFTDLYGRTLLERRHPDSGKDLDTYYVYDAMGRIAAVIPPALSEKLIIEAEDVDRYAYIEAEDVDRYAYLYNYDANGNCIAKKLPGCGWIRYIYDKGNRLIFSQDAEYRKKGKWMFSFSDIQGRGCVNGYCEGDFMTLKQAVSNSNVTVARQGNTNGTFMGYSLSGVSISNAVVLSVSYYDDYGFIDALIPSGLKDRMRYRSEYNLVKWDYVHGLLTGSAERVMGEDITNDFRWSTCYYDKKGNQIQVHTTRADGGVDVVTTYPTFTGKPMWVHISHNNGGADNLNEFYEYTYDNWERPLTVRHRMGENMNWTVLSDNKYDGIGRAKTVERNDEPALTTTFTYNVRSWTKKITAPGLSEELFYEDEGQWGGNISAIIWSSGTGTKEYRDIFGYDGFSRLSSSTRYVKSNSMHKLINDYTYDDHSNLVESVSREEVTKLVGSRAIKEEVKSFTWKKYNSDGNRFVSGSFMTGVGNPQMPTFSPNQQVSYSYDRNGRLTHSEEQGITEIRYNAVGYPSHIKTADKGEVDNTYTAGGTRLESRRVNADGEVTTMAYEGNEVFENGSLRMLLFDGGYVDFSVNEPEYCWYTTDHLGSVRAVTDASGNVFATYAYSPYGEDFAAERLNDKPLLDRIDLGSKLGGVATIQPNDRPQRRVVNKGAMGSPEVTYSAAEESDWQPFKFSGKESLTRVGLDLYDFGARMYSPSNMRWMTMDPLAEKYYHISPYAYCAGNPVNLVDPDGMQWYLCTHEDDHTEYVYSEGTMSEEDKKKYSSVVFKGYFFADPETNKYYSLFGREMPLSDENGACISTQIHKKVDEMIFTYLTKPLDEDGTSNRRVNMAIDGYSEGHGLTFCYRGKTFHSIPGVGRGHENVGDGTVFFTKNPENASAYLVSFPDKKYPLPFGPRKGYPAGYWIRAVNGKGIGEGQDIFRIKFDDENGVNFINSVNKIFNKHLQIEP